ncbi:MAG TPA: FkbM family methyltransferase [Puia sp.]|nr:FkbM family methyltransferase [Puia sp.]
MIKTIANKVSFRLKKITGSNKKVYKLSFSQCGEDLLIDYIFELRGVRMPTYLDIGAHDPFYLNNTAIFYLRGCRGINIEANPRLIGKFKKKRKEDINLNIGISDQAGVLDFYIMADSTLSTFSREESESMIREGHKPAGVKKIELMTVKSVLDKYNGGIFPDLLTIDVEGLDFKILQSIDFSEQYPKVICVEAAEYSPVGAGARRSELIDFLVAKGYYEYANTNLNAIMVKNEFWYL